MSSINHPDRNKTCGLICVLVGYFGSGCYFDLDRKLSNDASVGDFAADLNDLSIDIDPSDVRTLDLSTPDLPTKLFIQTDDGDGLVVMEAENHHGNVPYQNHAWQLVTRTGASDSMAMLAAPDEGLSFDTSPGPRLDFRANFVRTGTHYVWIRGWANDDYSDSCYAGLNGHLGSFGEFIGSGASSHNKWFWFEYYYVDPPQKVTINVETAGIRWVNVWMREDGFIVDKVVVTINADYRPWAINNGLGPDETY